MHRADRGFGQLVEIPNDLQSPAGTGRDLPIVFSRCTLSRMNRPEKTVKCVIVGLGRIGSTLEKDSLREKPASHAGAVWAHSRTLLAAGADPNVERREEFAADWNGVCTYADPIEMIRTEKPDIVHIASWTDTHPSLLEASMSEGVPVVVCEKPLANSLKAVRSLIRKARHSSSKIVMNHERRFSRDYRTVKDTILKKRLGELLSISGRLYMGRTQPPRAVLYHDGTHMIDIIRFLSGEDIAIQSVTGSPETKGGQLFICGKAGNVSVNLDISGSRDYLVFELDLSFTSGRIRIGNGIYEVWESDESPYYTGFKSLIKREDGWKGETGYFAGMMNHAVHLLETPELQSESALKDGIAVLKTIAAILKKQH